MLALLAKLVGSAASALQPYVLYIAAAIIAVSVTFGGIQTVRLTMAQKDLHTANAKITEKEVLLAQNKATLEQVRADGERLKQRVESSSTAIQKLEHEYTAKLKKIAEQHPLKPDASCEEAAQWALNIAKGENYDSSNAADQPR